MKTISENKILLDKKKLKIILELLGKEGGKVVEIEEVSDVAKYVYHFIGTQLKIEYKKFADLRYPQILTALLESYLSQKVEKVSRETSVAVIEIKHLFDRNKIDTIIDRVEMFLGKYSASGVNWMILDANGSCAGCVNNRRIEKKADFETYTDRSSKIIEKQSLQFTPTQQWLSKILILNGISSESQSHLLWPLKYIENIQDYKVLAKISGVSESSCFNFIKLLENKNFLALSKYQYQFKNLESFFNLWKSFSQSEKKEELFLTLRKPFGDMNKWQNTVAFDFLEFCKKQDKGKFVMGGHLACRAQGVDFSNNTSAIFYTSSVNDEVFEDFMSALKLRPSEDRNGDIRVILQKKDMPILRIDGLGEGRDVFADPIQLMLDVEYLGGRGKEQSDYIYEKVLLKHFKRWQWQN